MKKNLTTVLFATAFSCSSIASAESFKLTSPDLEAGEFSNTHLLSSPYGFGCSGSNVSPAFTWSGAPEGTKSFVLTIYDLDAPTGLGWVHWVLVNIPGNVKSIPGGIKADGKNLPNGAMQTRTDFGTPGYGGPCPPQNKKHRYEVALTALKIEKLPIVSADAMPALVGYLTKANSLGETKMVISQSR